MLWKSTYILAEDPEDSPAEPTVTQGNRMNRGLRRLTEVTVILSHCPLTHILADFLPHSRPKATSGEEKGNREGN